MISTPFGLRRFYQTFYRRFRLGRFALKAKDEPHYYVKIFKPLAALLSGAM